VTTCDGCEESLENHPVVKVKTRQVFDIPPIQLEVTQRENFSLIPITWKVSLSMGNTLLALPVFQIYIQLFLKNYRELKKCHKRV
jgi:hypothetical protein